MTNSFGCSTHEPSAQLLHGAINITKQLLFVFIYTIVFSILDITCLNYRVILNINYHSLCSYWQTCLNDFNWPKCFPIHGHNYLSGTRWKHRKFTDGDLIKIKAVVNRLLSNPRARLPLYLSESKTLQYFGSYCPQWCKKKKRAIDYIFNLLILFSLGVLPIFKLNTWESTLFLT